MQISQGWKWKISSVGGVLETVKQAQSHEITFRYSRSKAETQELCEDRRWILCPLFRKKLLIWWSVCGTIKWSPWNIWSTIYQTDHIWWDAHRPRKSPGLLDCNKQLFFDGYCERPCKLYWQACNQALERKVSLVVCPKDARKHCPIAPMPASGMLPLSKLPCTFR